MNADGTEIRRLLRPLRIRFMVEDRRARKGKAWWSGSAGAEDRWRAGEPD